MHLLVVGATGRTGRHVIEQAAKRGHEVTAVVRSATLEATAGLRVVVGDPCTTADLVPVLAGQDAVISCLGQRPGGNPWLTRDAAGAMLEAMRTAEVRRYLIVSGALLYPSYNPFVLLLRRILATRLTDGRAAEDRVSGSDLDWTIVRPPRLIEGSPGKGYQIEPGARPNLTWSLQFRDLADCLLDLAESGGCPRQVVGVASL